MPTAHGKAFGYGGSCPKLLQQEGSAILPQGRWWSIFPERRLDEFDPAMEDKQSALDRRVAVGIHEHRLKLS